MRQAIVFLAGLSLAIMTVGTATQAGNSKNGFDVAQHVCAECHAIREGQLNSPNPRSPSFEQVANTPGMTEAALLVALTTPHAGMPMFILTVEQRTDLIAYLLSLKH